MGTSSWNLKIITQLYDQGHFRMPAAIADLGAAQLGQSTDDIVRAFPARFGAQAPDNLNGFDQYSYMGDLYRMAGFDYVSLDVVDAPFVRKFDLNSDTLGTRPRAWWQPRRTAKSNSDLRGRFDLVLNFGTSEHVLNQHSVCRVMHDLAKPGGLLYGMYLINGFGDHGLIRYSSKFVTALVEANQYEILFKETHGSEEDGFVRDRAEWVVWRKTKDAPFQTPYDT